MIAVFRAAVLAAPVLACVSAMPAQTGEVKAKSQAELVALRHVPLWIVPVADPPEEVQLAVDL